MICKVSWQWSQFADSLSAHTLKQTAFCSFVCLHLKCNVTLEKKHDFYTPASFFSSLFWFFFPIHKSFQLRLTVKLTTVPAHWIFLAWVSVFQQKLHEVFLILMMVWLWLLNLDCGFVFVLFNSVLFGFFVCELWLVSNKVGLLESCDLEFSHYISTNLNVLNGGNINPNVT